MTRKRAQLPEAEAAARQAPPHNLEAERALLGSLLIGELPVLHQARQVIEGPEFFSEHHRRIWRAILSLAGAGRAVDLVTLRDELERAGDLELVGGAAYISGLVDGVPKSANIEHYARIVQEKALRRALQQRALLMAGACCNGHELHELREEATELFRASLASDPETQRRCAPTSTLMQEYAASIARGPGRRLQMGFEPLDRVTRGIGEGEVLTVVKRPQVGGSLFASQAIVNASRRGEPCAFFSLEMPREQAFERAVRQRLGLTEVELQMLAADGWKGLNESRRAQLDELSKNIVFIDRAKSGIADLDASMLEATGVLGRPPRLAVIDYLGLLGSGAKNLPLYQRVSEAAVDVKSFSKRHRVAVLLICQAGRDQVKRSEGAERLGLDAARDSGQVEEACDFLLTLWRPELSSDLTEAQRRDLRGQLCGALVKNRRGPRIELGLFLDEQTLRIAPLAPGGPT